MHLSMALRTMRKMFYVVLLRIPYVQSALAQEFARRKNVQGGFDVSLCGGCALLMYRMNSWNMRDAICMKENGGIDVRLSCGQG